MTKFIFTFLLILQSFSLFSQSYKLRLGINDCINCNAHLINLKKYIGDDLLLVILPESYQYDTEIVREKYGLDGMNIEFIFSDYEFNQFDNPKSYFIISNESVDDKITLLSETNFEKIFNSYSQKNICLENVNNFYSYTQVQDGLLLKNQPLGKFGIYDFNKGLVKQLFATKQIAKDNYKALYGNDWEKWYTLYETYAGMYPMVGTEFVDAYSHNIKQNEFLLLSQSSILIPPKVGTDTNAVKIIFLNLVKIENLEIINRSIMIPTNNLPTGYNLRGQIFNINNHLYIPIAYNLQYDTNVKVLAKYYFDKENYTLTFDKILPFKIPPTYISSGLNYNFNTYLENNGLITMSYSNVVYDCNTEKTYIVWNENNLLFSNLSKETAKSTSESTFYIFDIADINTETFYLLILNNLNQLVLVKYNKNKEQIVEEKIIDNNFNYDGVEFAPKFNRNSKEEIIYKMKNRNCFDKY